MLSNKSAKKIAMVGLCGVLLLGAGTTIECKKSKKNKEPWKTCVLAMGRNAIETGAGAASLSTGAALLAVGILGSDIALWWRVPAIGAGSAAIFFGLGVGIDGLKRFFGYEPIVRWSFAKPDSSEKDDTDKEDQEAEALEA